MVIYQINLHQHYHFITVLRLTTKHQQLESKHEPTSLHHVLAMICDIFVSILVDKQWTNKGKWHGNQQ